MEHGTVAKWEVDDKGKSKGFGFIETRSGRTIFCHRSCIKDGNALWPGSQVEFVAEENDGRPRATEVRGGVCFDHGVEHPL